MDDHIFLLLQGNRENVCILPVSGNPCHLRLVEDNLTFHLQGISDDKEFRLETTRNNERGAYSDSKSENARMHELVVISFVGFQRQKW